MRVKVSISNRQKAEKIPVGVRMLLRRAVTAVLAEEGFEGDVEVGVSFVDDREIRELNASYRDKDEVTDVLSFPLNEGGGYDVNPESGFQMLGDIVICVPQAYRQAKEYDHTIQRELAFLTVHSALHLLGYDHVTGEEDAALMRSKEEAVLRQLGETRERAYEEA